MKFVTGIIPLGLGNGHQDKYSGQTPFQGY